MMAGALMKALVTDFIKAEQLIVFDPSTDAIARLKTLVGDIGVAKSVKEATGDADVVFLATKPQYIESVAKECENKPAIYISIAAGLQMHKIEGYFTLPEPKLVRVMPNTPCLVGEMAAGWYPSSRLDSDDLALVGDILTACGGVSERVVKESLLDGVTGVSGSAPAYVFIMIEALADGGVKSGLPRDVALRLAAQVVKGSAEMVLTTGKHPGELKDQVCSPGGTTIEAVEVLESNGFRAALMKAVAAVVKKSKELANL